MKKIIFSSKEKIRIDKYLSNQNSGIPRRFFQNAIKNGIVLVNNKKISNDYQLKENDQILILDKIEKKEIKKEIISQKPINLNIIFQNQDFLILNKPPKISIHPSENENQNTLVNELIEKFPQIKKIGENYLRPGIVHRLDKDTSGIMIVALNQKSFNYFKNIFQNRLIQKTYLTVTWGENSKNSGIIESYIGKSNKNHSKQATSHSSHKLINPKDAKTFYKILKFQNGMSLIEVQPKTGRKHQIRIHLHSIGHPIIGDKKYFIGKGKDLNKKFENLMLHAYKIEFTGPDGKNYSFSAPIPKYFPLTLDQKGKIG